MLKTIIKYSDIKTRFKNISKEFSKVLLASQKSQLKNIYMISIENFTYFSSWRVVQMRKGCSI